MDDLTFVPTEDLVAELQKRNDHGVVYLIKLLEPGKVEDINKGEGQSGSNELNRYFWGDVGKVSMHMRILANYLQRHVACEIQMCDCCDYDAEIEFEEEDDESE